MEKYITRTVETTTAKVAPVYCDGGEIKMGTEFFVAVDGKASDEEIIKAARKTNKNGNFVIVSKEAVIGLYRARLADFLTIAEKIETENN